MVIKTTMWDLEIHTSGQGVLKLMLLDHLAVFRDVTEFVVQVRIYVVSSFPVFDQYLRAHR